MNIITPLILFIFLFPLNSIAEDMKLTDAWSAALKNHEAIFIVEESLEQARLDINKARSQILPGITFEGNYTRYSEKKQGIFLIQPEDSVRYELRVEQPLYSGGKEWALIRQGKLRLTAAKLSMDDTAERVLIEVARAYYGLLKAKKELKIKEASLKRGEEQVKIAAALFKVGSATKVDVLRSESELEAKNAEFKKARFAVKNAEDLLLRFTAWTLPVEISEEELGLSIAEDVEGLVSIAMERRRDLKEKVLSAEIAEEGIKYAKGNFLPKLSVEAVYQHREQNPETTFFLEDSAYAGLTLTLPFFEGGLRRAELSEAKSKKREAEFKRAGLKRDIEIEVRSSYNDVESYRSMMDSYKKQVSFAEENYQMVFKQYKNGISRNIDLIDADLTLTAAQLSLMSTRYDYELSLLELKRAVGALLDETEKGVIK